MHHQANFAWDDLRHLLALAQHGSSLAAGRALGVDQSTVQRRLAALERALGQALAQRHRSGYRLTEFGAEMLPFAQSVEAAVQAFARQVQTLAGEIGGTIRVTCPEPVVQRLMQAGVLDRFHSRHPALHLRFVMADRYLDLRAGEADVALRSGDTDDEELIGRKIGDSLWAVYASRAYLASHGQPQSVADLPAHALVGLDDAMGRHRAAQWMQRVAPEAALAARSSSVLGLIASVKAGLGVGPLPMALGDAEPDLVRVLGPLPELTRIWRVLTTRELRRTPRVAAFFEFIVGEIDALRPIFAS